MSKAERHPAPPTPSSAPGANPAIPAPRRPLRAALAVLLAITLAMFGDVLFTDGSAILSQFGTDLSTGWVYYLQFGFGELARGNLALWNPHTFCGTFFAGGFQPALFYPPNILYLVLPLGMAINIAFALHHFLSGLFMYLWASRRGLLPLPAMLTGILYMFCAPYFLHIYAGHVTTPNVLAWTPLLMLAIDGLFDDRAGGWRSALRWWLLGALAVGMQILGGYPQFFFYSAIAAAVYVALRLAWVMIGGATDSEANLRAESSVPAARGDPTRTTALAKPRLAVRGNRVMSVVLGMFVIYGVGVALSAVQLLLGMGITGESTRGGGAGGGVAYPFAAMFSLPPENLLTLLAPWFFGDLANPLTNELPYWGRCYLWEMSLFISVTGLVLAVIGVFLAPGIGRRGQHRFVLALCALVLVVLALGSHTPLFAFVYDHVPGFNKFRGNSKFSVPAVMFLIMLAGVGLDGLMRREPRQGRWYLPGLITGAAALLVMAGALWLGFSNPWTGLRPIVGFVEQARQLRGAEFREIYRQPLVDNVSFLTQAAAWSAMTLFIAAGTLCLVAILLLAMGRRRQWAFGLALLATLEIFAFGRLARPTFDLADTHTPQLEQFLQQNPGDYRILMPGPPDSNSAMTLGAYNIVGYDPVVPRRYAELVAYTQGVRRPEDLDKVDSYVQVSNWRSPSLAMLRQRFAIVPVNRRIELVELPWRPLSTVEVVPRYTVVTGGRDAVLAALGRPEFDPRQEVILESDPNLPAGPSTAPGDSWAKVIQYSTDEITIEAQVHSPSILLITESYSKDWRALALPGSSQQRYTLLPANHALRGVPVAAGKHHLKIQYAPRAYTLGMSITLVTALAMVAAWAWTIRRTRRAAASPQRHG